MSGGRLARHGSERIIITRVSPPPTWWYVTELSGHLARIVDAPAHFKPIMITRRCRVCYAAGHQDAIAEGRKRGLLGMLMAYKLGPDALKC